MNFSGLVNKGISLLSLRNRQAVERLKAMEKRITKLEQINAKPFQDPAAQLVVPGSPLLRIGTDGIGKIVGEAEGFDGERIYEAKLQVPSGHGVFEDLTESEVAVTVNVAGYPTQNDGSSASDRPQFSAGDYVYIKWDGQDLAKGDDYHHCIPVTPASPLKQFRVRYEYYDYIACKEWDGEVESEETTYIAKPYLLRRTPFHDKTIAGYTYTQTGYYYRKVELESDSTVYVNQIISPRYRDEDAEYDYDGDIIYATKLSCGTGITVQSGQRLSGDDDLVGSAVDYIDLNLDARCWGEY